jgi:hypothetical protein
MNDGVWLFSSGALQQEDVQLATFGRRLEGCADAPKCRPTSASPSG